MPPLPRIVNAALCLICALWAGCATPPPARAPEPARATAPRFAASQDCTALETPWQAYVCRDPVLATQDVEMAALWRRQWRAQDMAGQAELWADQRHWQLSQYPHCRLGEALPAEDAELPAATVACLREASAARITALRAMARPALVSPAGIEPPSHPLSAYVAFRSAQALEPALCSEVGPALDDLIARHGRIDATRVPGWQLLASSQGNTVTHLPDGRSVEVLRHDAGAYGGYELRALGLTVGGTRVIDDTTVPAWMLELPNAGGSASGTSSQTRDYASLDVFAKGSRHFVLVNQTWGYYASAARGESPHAGLFELTPQGLQRRCLWRTYIAPPVAQALRFLPQFKALQTLLDEAAGPEPMLLAPADRRDAELLYRQAQWQLLNMPLIGLHEAARHGRWPLLRQRHDEALEALFAWSERNVPSKQLYRRVMPLIPVAHAELRSAFEGAEGLRPDEARAAADLVLMAALSRAAQRLQDPAVARPAAGAGVAAPRYEVAPQPGALERGRPYGSLHSALLNRAAPAVVGEFMRHTWGSADRVGDATLGLGAAGDTPLMAAVRSPELVGQLLAAGAQANARNAWGKTALMMAAQADQADSVQRLLRAGADVGATTTPWQALGAGGLDNAEGARAGRTALHHAAATAGPAVIEALLAAGAQVQARDAHNARPCDALDDNPVLSAADRGRLRLRLCAPP